MANNFHRNINGSALVQILVGLVVGCAVILGAEKAYDIVNREYIEQVAHMSSASEEQYASAIFTTILDQAGYAGCGVDRSWQDNVYIGFGSSIFNEPVIYGIDDSDTEAIKKLNIDKDGSGKYAPRSDVLIVKSSGLSGQEALYKQLDSGQQQLDLITNLSIKEDDIILFHDCIQFNAFQVKEANPEQDEQKIQLYGEVPRNIPVGSILSIYQKSILYVGEAPRKKNGKQVYSLYEKNEYGVRNELIQNITSLNIEYLAENGEFVSANKITNWLLVKEIKIKLTTYQDDHVEEAHIAIKRNIP